MTKVNSLIYSNSLLTMSIIEAIYIVYFLNYFKTTVNFAHPSTFFNNYLFHHHVGETKKPRSMVCPFGKIISWIIAVYLIARNFNFNKAMNKNIIIIAFFLSLINFNVLIYIIPLLFIEIFVVQQIK